MGNRCLAHFPVHFAGCRPTHAPLGAQRNWRRDESSRRLHHGREERGTLPWSRVGIPMTLCVCARAPSPVQTSIGRDGTADCLVEEKLRWRPAAPHSSTRSVPAQVYPTPRSSLPCNNRGIERNASDGKPRNQWFSWREACNGAARPDAAFLFVARRLRSAWFHWRAHRRGIFDCFHAVGD